MRITPLPAGFRGRKVAASLKVDLRGAAPLDHPGFRGRKVAASLKGDVTAGVLRSADNGIPRPKGRGLIEGAPDRTGRSARRRFRGRKVAASLKDVHDHPPEFAPYPDSAAERSRPH